MDAISVSLEGVFRLIDRASPSLREIERRAASADRTLDKLGRTMDKLEARSAMSKVTGLSGEMGKLESSTNRVERAMDSAGASQKTYTRGLDDTSRKTKTATSDMGRFEAAMRKAATAGAGLAVVLAPGKMLLIAAAIRPIIGAIGALGAGAVGLVQQVGQATGALVPMIARLGDLAGAGAAAVTVMLSVKAAAAVTKFAMSGVTQAISGNVAAFKKLTPEARAFVLEMRKLQPIMNTLRSSAQKGLFPGLTGAVRTARTSGAAQVANTAVGGIGSAVGGLAQTAATQLTNPATLRDLAGISSTMDVVITKLGGSAVNLAQAFISILAAAQPLTRWIVATVDQWSKYLLQQVEIGRETGALGRYFDGTRQTLTNLGHTVRDFGVGFMTVMRVARGESGSFGTGIEDLAKNFRDWTDNFSNQARMALWFQHAQDSAHRLGVILEDTLKIFMGLGRASAGLGTSMTHGIDVTMDRWAAWVNSFQGQNELNKWFDDARSTLGQLWGLVTDLSGAFIKLGQGGGGAAGLIATIRTLIPDLVKVIQSISTNLGPGLFATVQQLAHLFATLTAASGSPLGMMLDLTASILTNVNDILDRFKGVRVAAGIAFTVVAGALLLQKLGSVALKVDTIAAAWRSVTGATQAATTAVAENAAVTAGAAGVAGVAGGGMVFRNGGFVGGSRGAAALEGGGAFGVRAGSSAETAAAESRVAASKASSSRLRGALGGRSAVAAGIGIPILAGVGASFAQSQGLIGGGTAGRVQSVASMAGTGALLGSFIGPEGTIAGAGIGAGLGYLTGGGGGQSATARYAASLQATAGRQGFDINQIQGGAQNITQANAYQHVLDQSLTGLQGQRNALIPTSDLSASKAAALAKAGVGGSVAQVHALDQQIALNQKLRGENIARLGVERATLKAQEKQTAELQKQARASASRDTASKLLGSYGAAYNVYRKAGMSVDQATNRVTTDMASRAKTLNPAGAQVLFAGGSKWLDQMKKQHPELSKEYDSWDTEMKATLKKMGVTMATEGGHVQKVTTTAWQGIRKAMQDPTEKAREFVSTKFTDIQMQGVVMLEALGKSSAQASLIISNMEKGQPGPTPSQLAAAGTKAVAAVAAGVRGPHHARGGRIGGSGLADTVPVAGLAAPGELIVNRHTESRVNQALGGKGTLGSMVAGERKRHSDILPGFALGGRVGAAVGEANRIAALRSTYLFGGGHSSSPAPAMPPWDCSSSTSRVLQAAGYNIPTMTAQQFMSWGDPGEGAIGVEASPGHVYMMLNGKPWGTSYSNYKGGPGWIHNGSTYRAGFVKRHAPNATTGGVAGTAGPAGAASGSPRHVANMVAQGFAGNLGLAKVAKAAAAGGGGGGGPAAPMHSTGLLSANQQSYLSAMAAVTGLDPNVLGAWLRNEEPKTDQNTDPSGHGRYNFLNVGITDSAPYGAASKWWNTSPSVAGAATGRWMLGQLSIPGFGKSAGSIQALAGVAGQSAQAQISAIQHSGWASGGETAMPSIYQEIIGGKYARGGRVPEWGGWHANGLDRSFDRPTMIGVGEKGKEHVTVTPAGGGRGGGGVVINFTGDIVIQGGADMKPSDIHRAIDQAFEELGRQIERQSLVEG